jgi:CRP-like cAMP-binding protein
MTQVQSVPANNRLFASLPLEDQQLLLTLGEPVELIFAEILCRSGEIIPHVYFPTGGFISLVAPSDGADSANLEVGLVGNEGMFGITLILGVEVAPFQALVQGAGPALRIPTADFLRVLGHSPALQGRLQRYLYVSMSQLAQTAACTRYHLVVARLARWLLMTQDRAHSDHFRVTHVFLAYMLGVRRVGITKAATFLQQQKLISYLRGDVRILDRAGLEAVACGCYQADKDTYERFLN